MLGKKQANKQKLDLARHWPYLTTTLSQPTAHSARLSHALLLSIVRETGPQCVQVLSTVSGTGPQCVQVLSTVSGTGPQSVEVLSTVRGTGPQSVEVLSTVRCTAIISERRLVMQYRLWNWTSL